MAILLCLILLAGARTAFGQQADPIAETLYSPEMLVRHADEVGLDAAQKQFIVSQARANRQKYIELHQNLQNEMAVLAGIVGQDHPREQAALDQLDKVLAAEREIKRMQLSLAMSIRGKLTPEQQAKARELRQKYASEIQRPSAPGAIRAKMQQLQERIKTMRDQGKDAAALVAGAAQVRQLIADGKLQEAESALDKVLAIDSDEKK